MAGIDLTGRAVKVDSVQQREIAKVSNFQQLRQVVKEKRPEPTGVQSVMGIPTGDDAITSVLKQVLKEQSFLEMFDQETMKSVEEAIKTREEMGVSAAPTMVDVTDTDQGQLSSPEPLFELGRQIREEDIKKEELPEAERAPESTPESVTSSWLDNELNTILQSEGGFQNDKEDTGNYVNGKLIGTNRGITPAALAEYRGVDPSTITVDDIKGVTEQEARDIYEQNYYLKPRINELPKDIQASVFDMNINAGRNSIKILQRLAGVKADGVIGPKTLYAVKEANITPAQYADARIEYYKKVVERDPDKSKYLNGWIRRANKYRGE